MVLRLYLVEKLTGRSTGKKRDYPSLDHFYKYGIETYERYNRGVYYNGEVTTTKAKLCFLNDLGKWEEFDQKYIAGLLNQEYDDAD